ncbi:ABC-2 type transport system ATP-binding protein [Georgenia satyanarayanai]|uniref:ABC-2 type transport system ATP-binding protein n=1 Tax=Georgenia satyanarayanai TaxID=860221 RepID=A0A2Y9AD61_9MICO|nr:ABC transporter ATP-binding protein [Georgenia satyanarayanai]PYF99924.1 ABC-2 type transport system ATP-binding protein [Georgenia satyanarayanai]SSA41926.1 ABC-2 type transport system ATP-binding protein [Georgenia satyanarayanai]
MSGLDVELTGLTVDYRDTRAVDSATVRFPADSITGLLGRNGSGKTSMLSTIASLRRPTSGTVRVDGRDPFEDERLMESVCLIRESGDVLSEEKLKASLELVASARPTWDQAYAEELLDAFGLDPRKKPGKLSRGQRSAFGAVIGLASRAPVTMFDEVYLGMDAPSRRRFYDLLIADYVEHPRTIILSSHLIGEVERLFENVVVLDGGTVLLAEEAETLRSHGVTVTGLAADVDAATAGLRVLGEQVLGPTKRVTVLGRIDDATLGRFRAASLELGAVPIEDLFIALTEKEARR